jgi:hypothetical protein
MEIGKAAREKLKSAKTQSKRETHEATRSIAMLQAGNTVSQY